MVGLLDTGADVTTNSPKSWHPDWPLQEVNIQLLGIEALSSKTNCKMGLMCKDRRTNRKFKARFC